MNETITMYQGERKGGEAPEFLTKAEGDKVRAFHKSLSEYEQTPLVSLDSMA